MRPNLSEYLQIMFFLFSLRQSLRSPLNVLRSLRNAETELPNDDDIEMRSANWNTVTSCSSVSSECASLNTECASFASERESLETHRSADLLNGTLDSQGLGVWFRGTSIKHRFELPMTLQRTGISRRRGDDRSITVRIAPHLPPRELTFGSAEWGLFAMVYARSLFVTQASLLQPWFCALWVLGSMYCTNH